MGLEGVELPDAGERPAEGPLDTALLARALRGGYFFYAGRRNTIKSGGYIDELLLAIDFALNRDDPFILFNFAYPEDVPSVALGLLPKLGAPVEVGAPMEPVARTCEFDPTRDNTKIASK